MKKLIAIIALLAATSTMQAQNKATDKGMAKPKKEKQTMVDIKTDYGTIRIKLYNETPKHRDNFSQSD
jgi:hypothetical protein